MNELKSKGMKSANKKKTEIRNGLKSEKNEI